MNICRGNRYLVSISAWSNLRKLARYVAWNFKSLLYCTSRLLSCMCHTRTIDGYKRKFITRRMPITRVAAFMGACVVWWPCLPSLATKGYRCCYILTYDPVQEMDKKNRLNLLTRVPSLATKVCHFSMLDLVIYYLLNLLTWACLLSWGVLLWPLEDVLMFK
jgi:hypothetical protein